MIDVVEYLGRKVDITYSGIDPIPKPVFVPLTTPTHQYSISTSTTTSSTVSYTIPLSNGRFGTFTPVKLLYVTGRIRRHSETEIIVESIHPAYNGTVISINKIHSIKLASRLTADEFLKELVHGSI